MKTSHILIAIILLGITGCNREGGFTKISIYVSKDWASNSKNLKKGWTKYFDGSVEIYDLAWGITPESKPTKIITDDIETTVLVKTQDIIQLKAVRRGEYEGSIQLQLPKAETMTLRFNGDGSIVYNGRPQ